MKPQDYIPKPCHEDWSKMTGPEQKKFCNKCTTHVHDLTDMSDEEIKALKVQNGGSLCGSFHLPSLARPLVIGAGVASLALASCSEVKKNPEVIMGECMPGEVHKLTGSVVEPDTPDGEVKKPVKLDPIIGEIVIEQPPIKVLPNEPVVPPFEPQILGMVCPPDQLPKLPSEEPRLQGDICVPNEPQAPVEPQIRVKGKVAHPRPLKGEVVDPSVGGHS